MQNSLDPDQVQPFVLDLYLFLKKKCFQDVIDNLIEFKLSTIPGPEVIKLFSCSTQLSMKFIMLINVKMPTIVGILTFISIINTTSESLKA